MVYHCELFKKWNSLSFNYLQVWNLEFSLFQSLIVKQANALLFLCSPQSRVVQSKIIKLKPDHSLPLQGSSNKSSSPLGWLRCCSVQFSRSVMSDSLRPYGLQHARLPCPSPTHWACSNSCPLKSVMPSNHLILCCSLFLLLSILLSIRVFSNESVVCIRWPKYCSFRFNVSPSNEQHSGLISFRIVWFALLAAQRTLKSPLQHHTSKASILWCSVFFIVQLSHTYMTTGKTIALTRQTFVGKVMSLLFNMLSRLVITCLPRSKRLLISWLLRNSNPLQYSCLENSMDRGAWQAAVHGVAKNQTQLSQHTHSLLLYSMWFLNTQILKRF